MLANNESRVRSLIAGSHQTAFPIVETADGSAPSFPEIIGDFGRVIGMLLALAMITNVIVIALTRM